MPGPEIAILLLFEAVCGAAGAVAVARLWRTIGFEWKSIAAIGAFGALILALLAMLFPGLARFVGYMGVLSTPCHVAPAGSRSKC